MNDIKRVEEFLNLMKTIATENVINKIIVYNNLVYPNKDKESIEELFPIWIKEFKDNQNIEVYIPEKWNDFCQFRSKQKDNFQNNKIKIYIAIDKAHIEESVKKIFHYLTKINAIHVSKVAKNIRYDNIVIRVNNMNTVKKILKFINSDSYIKEGIINTNPFAFHDEFISYTWDGELSYNMVISTYIANYINTLKNNNNLNQVSYNSFISYLKDIYEEVFINGNNIDLYKKTMDIEDYNIPDEEVKEKLLNYKFITRIFLKALMPDKKINDFYEEYQRVLTHKNSQKKYPYHIFHKK